MTSATTDTGSRDPAATGRRTTLTPPRREASVGELQRAWRAVRSGQFSDPGQPLTDPAGDRTAGAVWVPNRGERVLPVVGAGSCGATTVALAVAESASGGARVVECGSVTTSGLVAASTAELGRHRSGWVQGTRGGVLLERTGLPLTGPGDVPVPSPAASAVQLTVLDVCWELGPLMASRCWLAEQVEHADQLVLVAAATVPGLRRLESTLGTLAGRVSVVAVVGPARKRWPAAVRHSLGPSTQAVDRAGALVVIPFDRRLAFAGLDSTPLPAALTAAATQVLAAIGHSSNGAPS